MSRMWRPRKLFIGLVPDEKQVAEHGLSSPVVKEAWRSEVSCHSEGAPERVLRDPSSASACSRPHGNREAAPSLHSAPSSWHSPLGITQPWGAWMGEPMVPMQLLIASSQVTRQAAEGQTLRGWDRTLRDTSRRADWVSCHHGPPGTDHLETATLRL